MAGIEIKGFEELRRNTERLQKTITDEAIQAAEAAAAEVIRDAVQRAAPVSNPKQKFRTMPKHPSGQLRASVKIFKGKDKSLIVGGAASSIGRILIGPEKKTGFYGYFVEKGWMATGPHRRARIGTKTSHSQRGVKSGHQIQARPWMEPITLQVEEQAQKAGEAAFEAALSRSGF